ncbi:Gfo/Idh/MocA family protein [Desulfosediminicola flagellatus]|uniref:Gfo/Idh/MocA family protein n=1 Tax=Desulfosediminicola flagellatus TaxID=2569541 RepID=UPI0010AD8A0E|nr:Gfo/Idh/MocA family oxidoreductase [Desulfosediminicola flagellatus]
MSIELRAATESLTYGMVGGGQGAFIGEVHRKAIGFDSSAELTCGCFSRDYKNTLATGTSLGIAQDRLYKNYKEMAEVEGRRSDSIDFVVIVTPNASHYPIAKLFLERGINVVCDKPFTVTTAQAEELVELAERNNLTICLTYTYTGYPIAKHVRDLVVAGELGDIRFVNAEYPQEWLSTLLEETDHKQASWRGDPDITGLTNSVGDIGSHIENMVSFMTGLKIERLSARLDTLVAGRKLDDNVTVMVDYHGGARGLYWCSQIAVGNDNGLRVRIFGSKGSIDWAQENPNYFNLCYLDKPLQRISRGRDALSPLAQSFSRVPAGHPEGYFEAFANIYKAFTSYLRKLKSGAAIEVEDKEFPTAADGLAGVHFIEKCVESSRSDSAWVKM